MINAIGGIQAPAPIEPIQESSKAESAGSDFRTVLADTVGAVESANATANAAIHGFLTGENQELHSTVLATQRATLAFDMFMQARNKVVSAYQEVMKMQV